MFMDPTVTPMFSIMTQEIESGIHGARLLPHLSSHRMAAGLMPEKWW